MFFIVFSTCWNLNEYVKQQESIFTALFERQLNHQPLDAHTTQVG